MVQFVGGSGGSITHKGRPAPPPLIPFLPQLGPGPPQRGGSSRPGPVIPFLPQLGTGHAATKRRGGHGPTPRPGSIGASFPKVLPGGKIVPGTPAKGSLPGQAATPRRPVGTPPPLSGGAISKHPPPGKFSYGQLEQLWINAGGPRSLASEAAAIAMAESGGNSLAAYPGTTVAPGRGSPNDATGLWQILGLPAGNFSASQLTDPASNAAMAVAKFRQAGNSFSPWQTYQTGAYIPFLRGNVPPSALPAPGPGGTGTGPGSAPPTEPGASPGPSPPGQVIRIPGGGTITIPPEGLQAPGGGGGSGVSGRAGTPTSSAPSGGGGTGTSAAAAGGGGLTGIFTELPGTGGVETLLGGATSIADVGNALGTISNTFSTVISAVDWLFVPTHWVRIFAGVGGAVLTGAGIIQLSHTGSSMSIPGVGDVSYPRAASLPLGILMVGAGGVLLFVAFHNLPDTVDNFPALVSFLTAEVRSGTKTPAFAPDVPPTPVAQAPVAGGIFGHLANGIKDFLNLISGGLAGIGG